MNPPRYLSLTEALVAFPLGMLLAVFLLWLAVDSQLGVPSPNTASLHDRFAIKIKRAQSIVGPKTLICGGSSVLYGLRADVVTRYTGVPAINLAVAGAFGMSHDCFLAGQLARPGDTILLAYEYEAYDWVDIGWSFSSHPISVTKYNTYYDDYLLAYEPEFYRQLPPLDKARVILTLSNRQIFDGLLRKVRGWLFPHTLVSPASTEVVDAYGDGFLSQDIKNHTAPVLQEELSPVLAHGLRSDPAGFVFLRNFIQDCRAHSIRVLATWPNLLYRTEYLRPVSQEVATRIKDFFQSENVPVLGTYDEFLLPRERFAGTIYHMLESSTEDRTMLMLRYWPDPPRRSAEPSLK